MSADTPEQLEGLRAVGALVADTIVAVRAAVRPGVTTKQLDDVARRLVQERGGASGPILTYDYPGWICLSVNDEVVHGIPGRRILQDGDVLKIDVALELGGYHADSAVTVIVGEAASRADERLIATTDAALKAGIRAARAGATLRDIGTAVERVADARGFHVIRELTGHGIGRAMHEAPTVHNYPAPGPSQTLTAGMVFTIEPMLAAGSPRIYTDGDGWTLRTIDRARAAHAEHTIMVTEDEPLVLTSGL